MEATGLPCPGRMSGTFEGSYPSHTSMDSLSPMALRERTASRCVAPRRLVPFTWRIDILSLQYDTGCVQIYIVVHFKGKQNPDRQSTESDTLSRTDKHICMSCNEESSEDETVMSADQVYCSISNWYSSNILFCWARFDLKMLILILLSFSTLLAGSNSRNSN